MYAIIEDSGTQIKVSKGDVLDIDVRPRGAKANDTDGGESKPAKRKAATSSLTFDRVLMIGGEESDKPATIGTPYIDGASVTAEVIEEFRGEKIDVIMYKRRKGQRRKIGHRQSHLKVKITGIQT